MSGRAVASKGQRVVASMIAGLVLVLLPVPGASGAETAPTAAQISLLRTQVTVYVRVGAITNAGVAEGLTKKLDEAKRALDRQGPAAARRSLKAFEEAVRAQRGKHISSSAADALVAISKGEAPPTTLTVAAGTATTVATAVGTSTVVVDVPAGTAIAAVSVAAPTATTPVPRPPSQYKVAASIVVTAVDAGGQTVSDLSATPLQIRIAFTAPPKTTATGATIFTLNAAGANESLATNVEPNGDGTFSASAPTPHLSPFVVFVPPSDPVPPPAVLGALVGGYAPQHVAVNPVTNRAYVSVPTDAAVGVIDLATNTALPPITLGTTPSHLVVDTANNRLFVAAPYANKVFVVNTATNGFTAILFPADLPYPEALAFDSATARLYVVHSIGVVSVVDTTNSSVGQRIDLNRNAAPLAAAVNPATGRVYVSNCRDQVVSIIDGPAGSLLGAVAIGSPPPPPTWPPSPTPMGPGCASTQVVNDIAVNTATNKVYAVNSAASELYVIDGKTDAVSAPVSLPQYAMGVDVDGSRNRIYVGSGSSGQSLSVLDGDTLSKLATITVGSAPTGVAVNPTTGQVFVADGRTSAVSVVDGTSNAVSATVLLGVGPHPGPLAVNENTGKVYVPSSHMAGGTVIDGSTNEIIALVPVPGHGGSAAVNHLANRAYFGFGGNRPGLAAVDGTTNVMTLLPTTFPAQPTKIGVDATTNRVYVPYGGPNAGGSMAIVNGDTGDTVATLPVGSLPSDVAVNLTTRRAYVTNNCDKTVSVIDMDALTVVQTVNVGGPYLTGSCLNYLQSAAVDASRNLVYLTSPYDRAVHVLDGSTNTITNSIIVGGEPAGIDVSAATGRLWVTDVASSRNLVHVYDTSTNAKIAELAAGHYPTAVAVNGATYHAYVSNAFSHRVTVLRG